MPDRPTLYVMPGTCALAPNIAVAWLDAPVDVHNLKRGEHKEPAYLAINPRGKVPAVRLADGSTLTEAAAILAWLGATWGSEGYARDETLGMREAEALSYMTSEVHATYGAHFAPHNFAASEAAQDEAKEAAYRRLEGHYDQLEATLKDAGGRWYLGQRSFADAYLYVVCRWIELTPLELARWPALVQHRHAMEADEGVTKALARQGMEPVG